MNASRNGRIKAPIGINAIRDSQGDRPAFLQMNQKGRTMTAVRMVRSTRITSNSEVPKGPIEASSRWWVDMVVS